MWYRRQCALVHTTDFTLRAALEKPLEETEVAGSDIAMGPRISPAARSIFGALMPVLVLRPGHIEPECCTRCV